MGGVRVEENSQGSQIRRMGLSNKIVVKQSCLMTGTTKLSTGRGGCCLILNTLLDTCVQKSNKGERDC